MRKGLLLVTGIIFLVCQTNVQSQTRAHEINEKLGRGINLGNTFEAPRDNDWGMTLSNDDIENIAKQGFNHIRIPIRWNEYAAANAPYTIESWFIDTISKVVDAALENKMLAIINIHHYDSFNDNPESYHLDRFLAIWKQISAAFKDYPDSLLFEFLNEPHQNLDAAHWNPIFKQVLDTVRVDNPTRICVVGPPDWNGVGSVNKLEWTSDTNMIMTVHYYNPFNFTHQGAGWVGDQSQNWLGTTWDSTAAQRQAVIDNFADARAFSETHNVPVHVGEFGAYSAADDVSRRKWTAFCARTFESFGFSWAYWEYQAGFGAYDPARGMWRNFLLYALTERIDPNSVPIDPWDVRNGSFTNELNGWSFQATGDAVAEADVSNETGVFDISVVDGTNWHIQLYQSEISLIQGAEYRLSFDAWTSQPGQNLVAYLGMSVSPYTAYTGFPYYELNGSSTRYEFEFTMEEPSDPNARLVFNLGEDVGTIYLDSVRIEQLFVPVLVEELVIEPDTTEITLKGDSAQLSVTVLPEEANNKDFTWAVIQGLDIAEVTGEGVVKALGTKDGKVIVEATAADGSGTKAMAVVYVSNQLQVEEIILTPTSDEISTYQGTVRILNEVLPSNASDPTLSWSVTQGEEFATVSQMGILTAKGTGDGEVTIRASSIDGSGVFAEVTIMVKNQVLAEQVTISADQYIIDELEGSLQLYVTFLPENTSRKEVAWKVTEGDSKVSVDQEGLVTASGYGNGLVKVRASVNDGSGVFDEVDITLSNQNSGLDLHDAQGLKVVMSEREMHFSFPMVSMDSEISLFNIHGQVVVRRDIPAGSEKLVISAVAYRPGIYFVKISGDGRPLLQRVLIR